jgi:hypothetical protein
MLKLIAKPLDFLSYLGGLALPMFAGPRAQTAEAANPVGRWFARLFLLAIVLTGLTLINRWLGLWIVIRSGPLSRIWLPLFALCVYAMIWLGWLLWRVLNLDVDTGPTSEFPDIDRAWDQAMEALTKASIALDETPLFLVLGWTSSSEEALFRAAGIKAQVRQIPRDLDEPLHVTAARDSIWITCPGASVLGQWNPAAAADFETAGGGLTGASVGFGGGAGSGGETLMTLSAPSDDPLKTMGVPGFGETLAIEEIQARLKNLDAAAASMIPARKSSRRVFDPEPYRARLRHLARLIARDRLGFCPINGVLVVLPISAADTQADTEGIAAACCDDLGVIFDAFQMRCPVLSLVGDLETLTGFTELVERLPRGQSGKRIGQRFPLASDLKPAEIPGRVASSIEWIGGSLFPSMVYSLFQLESPGGEDVSEVVAANTQLYRFMIEIRNRQERLADLVKGCLPSASAIGEPILFGGCYFAGTGEDAATQQAFAAGVLRRLVDEQDHVAWTEESVERDRRIQRTARLLKVVLVGYLVIGSLAALALVARQAGLLGFDGSA